MINRLLATILLGSTVAVLGPVACDMAQLTDQVAATPGTEIGIRRDWMDTAAKPGNDFFRYANGKWFDSTQIPADRSNIGGFYIADLKTEKNLAALIDGIVKSDPEPGTDAARVKSFYQSFMDTKAIDGAGMKPIAADLARFAAIKDKIQLATVLGQQTRADVDPLNSTDFETGNLFGVFVTQALKGGEVVPYPSQ